MTLLPRVLVGVAGDRACDLQTHTELVGPMPDLRRWAPERLIAEVERSGLRGRGGAAFPVATKLRAVSKRRGPRLVLVNGSEGEPASDKDRLLLLRSAHLVLDGASVAARAVGSSDAIVAVPEDDDHVCAAVATAIGERGSAPDQPRFELAPIADGFVSGQESALVNGLSGGEPRPSFGKRPFEQGVRRRPTLVQNVETLAHLALIARHGATWFRGVGTERDPGSALVTLSGAVSAPGVYEVAHGTPLTELLDDAGLTEPLAAVLVGGYFGTWSGPAAIERLLLSPGELTGRGAALGAGVIVALGAAACPVAETSRVADYFALESAGQCGPCVNGLSAIADTLQQVASGTAAATAPRNLARWSSSLAGRGACQFPDGATRFVASALRVFASEFEDHMRHGPCSRCAATPSLPVPISAMQ